MSIIIITMAHHHHHRGLMFKSIHAYCMRRKWITRRKRRKRIQTQRKREREKKQNRIEMEKLSLQLYFLVVVVVAVFHCFFLVCILNWLNLNLFGWLLQFSIKVHRISGCVCVCVIHTYIQTDNDTKTTW